MKSFVDGSLAGGAPDLEFGMVDVRDVARAHVVAGFTPTASGRYITSADSITMLEMGRILRKRFGHSYPFPLTRIPKPVFKLVAPVAGFTREFVDKNVGYPLKFDNSRSREELGLTYRDPADTVVEQFQQMIDDGLVHKPIGR